LQSPTYMETLKELQETLSTVDGIKVANRGSPLSNLLVPIADGIPMLGWVTVESKPHDYVQEFLNPAQYYGNRLITQYKET
jgi:adenylyl cyclase-associated protein